MANYPSMLRSLCTLVAGFRLELPDNRVDLIKRNSKPLLEDCPDELLVFGDLVRMTLEVSISCGSNLDDWVCSNMYLMFPQLSVRTRLLMLVVAEQLEIQGLPVEDILCIASEMRPCQLIRFITKALDIDYLCNPDAPLFSSQESLAKLLPIKEDPGYKLRLTRCLVSTHKETRKGGLTDIKKSSERFLVKYVRLTEEKKRCYIPEVTRLLQLLVLAISNVDSEVLRKVLRRLVSKVAYEEFQVIGVAAALKCYGVLEAIYEAKNCWIPAFQAACLSGKEVDMRRYLQNCITEPDKAVLTLRALEAGVRLNSGNIERYVQHTRAQTLPFN